MIANRRCFGNLEIYVLDSLSGGRSSVDRSMQSVRELVGQIQNFQRINEQVETISSRFRVIRINIRIQCSSSLIDEEMFHSVTEDIDALSRKLNSITNQIKKDLYQAVRKLTLLEQDVTKNLQQFARVSIDAKELVSHTVRDINQLMNGAVIMIEEVGTRSKVISEKMEDVVVSIQFHDSLSQRAAHIQHALDDVCELLDVSYENLTPEHMGSAWYIIELQYRQLKQIVDEVVAIKHRIQSAFHVMEREVSGLNAIDCNSRFEAIGPQQFLSTLFVSLQDALMKLCTLLSSSQGMLGQLKESAQETKCVVDNMQGLMKDIQGMRDDTRLQAANTIIMASNLGQQGRAIQVLAKEISSLSGLTGDVTGNAEMMQLGIANKVTDLLEAADEESESINIEEVDDITRSIGNACHEVEQRIIEVSSGIKDTGKHIEEVSSVLSFLENLQESLISITGAVQEAKDMLVDWQDLGSGNSEEVEQLVKRYTMDRERKVHSFDRVDEQTAGQNEEEIFF